MKHSFTLLPVPTGMKVKIYHTHDPKVLRFLSISKRPPRYLTEATLVDTATNTMVAMAFAWCSPKDTPSRKLGRAIAHNRCITNYMENPR